jgi:hypothetical protein
MGIFHVPKDIVTTSLELFHSGSFIINHKVCSNFYAVTAINRTIDLSIFFVDEKNLCRTISSQDEGFLKFSIYGL